MQLVAEDEKNGADRCERELYLPAAMQLVAEDEKNLDQGNMA